MAFKRKMTAKFAGKSISLAATFAAAEEISDTVSDPLVIGAEADKVQRFNEMGLPYQPRFQFTTQNVVQIIHIGAKAGGETLTVGDVQELVFEHGLANSTNIASEYLGLIIGPGPAKPLESSKDAEPGE